MQYQFTLKSRNTKTGPIPVTTSQSATCPDACPLKSGGCYAKGGPLAVHWRRLDAGSVGISAEKLHEKIAALAENTLWRHNQAGDLPGIGDSIDAKALASLVAANAGKRGFTYTHKPPTPENLEAIKSANAAGFTINLSANNLMHADTLAETGAGPVVVVLPMEQAENAVTPAGRTVVVCPATKFEYVTCASCQLCQRRKRKTIIGFPAHGPAKRKASAVASLFY